MQLSQLNDQLDVLTLKVRQLVVRLRQMQGLNEELTVLNQQLKKELHSANERIKHLEQAGDHVPTQANTPAPDNRELKRELQQYIKELDKCIESLQKQAHTHG
jgi:uncharacterized coiled-coil DUF342 family protein